MKIVNDIIFKIFGNIVIITLIIINKFSLKIKILVFLVISRDEYEVN